MHIDANRCKKTGDSGVPDRSIGAVMDANPCLYLLWYALLEWCTTRPP